MMFGRWQLNESNLTLLRTGDSLSGGGYEVDLERCRTSAEVLDWIVQIHRKCWGPDAVSDLVSAFSFLLKPQQTMCGCGIEHGPIDVKALITELCK